MHIVASVIPQAQASSAVDLIRVTLVAEGQVAGQRKLVTWSQRKKEVVR